VLAAVALLLAVLPGLSAKRAAIAQDST
jgi:hypothetical protein